MSSPTLQEGYDAQTITIRPCPVRRVPALRAPNTGTTCSVVSPRTFSRWLEAHTSFAFVGHTERLSVLKEARPRDPNELVILMEWNGLEKARQFTQSEDLREVMQRAGVVDQSDIYFLKDGEQVSR
jgi:hypothetical protein